MFPYHMNSDRQKPNSKYPNIRDDDKEYRRRNEEITSYMKGKVDTLLLFNCCGS